MSAVKPVLAMTLCAVLLQGGMQPFATVTRIQHSYTFRIAKQTSWIRGKLGMLLRHGDSISTSALSRAEVTYRDGTVARLGPKALLILDQPQRWSRWGWGRFMAGKIWLKVAKGDRAQIVTPAAVASVIGTEFVLDVAESHATKIIVLDGAVDFTGTKGDTIRVNGGFWGEAIPGQPLKPPQPIDPASRKFAQGLAAPVVPTSPAAP